MEAKLSVVTVDNVAKRIADTKLKVEAMGCKFMPVQSKYIKTDGVHRFRVAVGDGEHTSLTDYAYVEQGIKDITGLLSYAEYEDKGHYTDVHRYNEITFDHFDASGIEIMDNLFDNISAETITMSDLDTSNVISMKKFMYGCEAKYIDLRGIDTHNVKYFDDAFATLHGCTIVGLNALNTSSAISIDRMFAGVYRVEGLEFDKLDFSNVKSAKQVFIDAEFDSLDLRGVRFSAGTDLSQMFAWASINSVIITKEDVEQYKSLNKAIMPCVHFKIC